MKKHLKTLATAMLCLAMALLVSCKKDNVEPSGGGGGETPGGETPGGGTPSTPTIVINGHECVDLGLPSGLLWATCNVGAESPEDYGEYYAWGEISTKYNYKDHSYMWYNSQDDKYTKYCTSESFGYVDNKTTLEYSDDVARVLWGGKWRMPSNSEFMELANNCKYTITTQNGVKGMTVEGPNGNSIFFPTAGFMLGTYCSSVGTWGNYWSCSLLEGFPAYSYDMFIATDGSGSFHFDNYIWRYRGLSVRPVCSSK